MISDTEPVVSIKKPVPLFDPNADHAPNICGVLGFAESKYGVCSGLAGLTDGRASNVSHPFRNMIGLLFSMHLLQYPSLNAFLGPTFDGSDSKTSKVENCCMKIVTGGKGIVKTRPSLNTAYNTLAKIDPEELRELNSEMIEKAIGLGVFAESNVDGHLIFPLDGTGTHSAEIELNPKYCQVKEHKSGKITYHHSAVFLSLALPAGNVVVDWEMRNGADSTKKGEAEISCALRMLPRVNERFPGLLDIVTVDALYPCASMVNLARELDFTLVARIKDHRRKAINESRERFDTGSGSSTTFIGENNEGERFLVTAHWVDDFVMAGTDKPVRVVRFLEIPIGPDGTPDLTPDPETGEPAKQKEEWVIVTSDDLSIELIWKALHLRWRIENNCFRQLKSSYHLEHLYSHQGVAASIGLIVLAFNVRELFEMRYTLYNPAGQLCSKSALTDKLRDDLKRRKIAHLFAKPKKRKQDAA